MQSKLNAGSARAGLLMVMLSAVLWGTSNAIAKSIYDLTPTNPTSIAFFRMAISVPALLVICWRMLGKKTFTFQKRDLPMMLVTGVLVALYQASFYASLPRIGVAIATVIALASAPVLVAVLSAFITKERPPLVVIIALLCAVLGTVLLVNVSANTQQTDVFGGVAFALLAGLLYAINTLVGRKLGKDNGQTHPLQTTLVGFAFGTVLLFIIALGSGLVVRYPPEGWLRLGYLGIIGTAIGYGLFYSGMRTTSASSASIATLMEPLTATVIAVLFLNEPLSPQALIGGVLMLVAMLVLWLGERSRV